MEQKELGSGGRIDEKVITCWKRSTVKRGNQKINDYWDFAGKAR